MAAPKKFTTGPAPHLHAAEKIADLYWNQVLSLLPVFLLLAVRSPLLFPRNLLICIVSAILTEILFAWIFQKKPRPDQGANVLSAMILALLLPAQTPVVLIAVSVGVGISMGRELFGGLGFGFLNPAFTGFLFFGLGFPGNFQTPGSVQHLFVGSGPWSFLGFAGFVLAAGWMIFKRLLFFEAPVIYFLMVLIPGLFLNLGASLAWGSILVVGLYGLTDPETTPLTRAGLRWMAVAAGMMTLFLYQAGAPFPEISAFLLMGFLTPWLDARFSPKGAPSRAV